MPIAITEDQRAFAASIRRWAVGAGTIAAVRGREPGVGESKGPLLTPDAEQGALANEGATFDLRPLAELGVFALGLPEEVGGTGTVTDLAVALEQLTDALVPGPVMPTVLAGLLLSAHTATPAVKELLPLVASGTASVAVGSPAGPVLGAGETTHLLVPDGPRFLLLESSAVRVTPLTPVDFSRRLGTVSVASTLDDRAVSVSVSAEAVRDTLALLASVEAAAVADWCVRTATAHALVRRQFGRPIGSFQAIQHLCATMLCRAERACALAWDASVAYGQSDFSLAVAAAASVALDAAVDNAKDCIQVLGGIGFTWEHDVHLYLRRAVALRALAGDTALWRSRVAELALGGARRVPRPVELVAVDQTVRSKVAEIASLPADERRAALADAGYLTPGWPRPYGLSAGPAEQLALAEELATHGVARPDLKIAGWALPTIIKHGTDEQRERFVGPSLRGELAWCQLFSEPEAGSDLASLRTRAVRVEGGWLLSGQKVWTSLAHEADWAICLARSDGAAPKHKGITYFLVAMDSPGLEIRPLREITGRVMFNEVFLDDVFVPDRFVVGAPGDGWRLARGTLEHERVAMGRGSSLGEGVERLLAAVHASGTAGDPGVADRLGSLVADGLAVSTVEHRALLRRIAGEPEGAESAVRKLIGVAHRQAVGETGLLQLGPFGAVAAEEVQEFLLTRCLSIAGGTSQVLLSLVAQRVLGLPREEVADGA